MITRWIIAGIIVLITGFSTYYVLDYKFGGQPYGKPFTLVDQRGAPITEAAFRGHPSAVFFGFTNCPEICPTTLFDMDNWLKRLGGDGKDIRAYFVTVDPERDTQDILNTYVSGVSDRITGITGESNKIATMLKDFGITAIKEPTSNGDYTMIHTASVFLLDRHGALQSIISYDESSTMKFQKMKRLADEG